MRGCVSLRVRPGVKASGSPLHIQVTSELKGLSSYPRLTIPIVFRPQTDTQT